MTQDVSTSDVARYLAKLNAQDEVTVDKILVRRISERTYACQIWERGARDPEAVMIQIPEDASTAARK
jgi:hypothetical protein